MAANLLVWICDSFKCLEKKATQKKNSQCPQMVIVSNGALPWYKNRQDISTLIVKRRFGNVLFTQDRCKEVLKEDNQRKRQQKTVVVPRGNQLIFARVEPTDVWKPKSWHVLLVLIGSMDEITFI